MKEKILAALATFEITNDSYWTEDGLPVLEAVQHIAKDATITRDMITATAPGFSRSNPSLEVGVVAPVIETPMEAVNAPQAEAPPEIEAAPDEELNVVTETKEPKEDIPTLGAEEVAVAEEILANDGKADGLNLTEQLALREKYLLEQKGLSEQIAGVVDTRAKLTTELNRLYILEEQAANKVILLEDVNKQAHALQSYFKSEQAKRTHRGDQLKKIKEAGIDLNALTPQRSRLDQAMKRNTMRGTKRPQLPRL